MTRQSVLLVSIAAFTATLATTRIAAATCTVTAFGATGNGTTDDRAAIQAAIDSCSSSGDRDVFFPSGTYLVTRAGSSFQNLGVPSGMRLRGASQTSVMLKQAAGMGTSVRLLQITGSDVHIEDMTLDGNKANQSVDEQRHGIFATSTNRLIIQHVTAQNFTGDGFTLFNLTSNATVRDSVASGNNRNGITMNANTNGAVLTGSRFIGNAKQQVDSEPGSGATVDNISITDCTIDNAGVSTDYALTISGSPTTRSHDWSVAGNTIGGAVRVVWTAGVAILGNRITNPTGKGTIELFRKSSNVSIVGNDIHSTWTQSSGPAGSQGVLVQGAGPGDTPERVIIADNTIKTEHPASLAVRAEGAVTVSIINNHMRGPATALAGGAAISIRATIPAEDFRSAVITGNTITDFGQYGIVVSGSSTSSNVLLLDISHNVFDDDTPAGTPATMTIAMSLDEANNPTGAAKQVTLIGNRLVGRVTTEIDHFPSKAFMMIGGSALNHPMYSVVGSPEGKVKAPIGATAIRRDGTPGATLYVKESGTDVTGWVAK
jgi:hypothetical protein